MRRTVYLVILGLALIFVVYAFLTVDKRSDEKQIRSLISRTATCIQRRDIGGTVCCVSKHYRDNDGFDYDRLRLVIAEALRDAAPNKTRAEVEKIISDGDTATVEVHATIALQNGENLYDQFITLHLKKEPARHKLIVPVNVWRVTKVDHHSLS